MAENAAAVGLRLDEAERAWLDSVFAPDAVAGARYTPEEAARAGT